MEARKKKFILLALDMLDTTDAYKTAALNIEDEMLCFETRKLAVRLHAYWNSTLLEMGSQPQLVDSCLQMRISALNLADSLDGKQEPLL